MTDKEKAKLDARQIEADQLQLGQKGGQQVGQEAGQEDKAGQINSKITVLKAGGVTSPQGFSAAGIHCGLKKKKKDLALIASQVPGPLAGVFTQNKVAAAPVVYGRELVAAGQAQAILVNSGNANACTGQAGYKDALATAQRAEEVLSLPARSVLVSSTGVIGYRLPMDTLLEGVKDISGQLSKEGGQAASQAILTTDTFTKSVALHLDIGGKTVTVGGMSKGSGMIHPNMATMLGFITTDCHISQSCLQDILADIADRTFNMITVDGDTSTNDSLICLANGLAGNPKIEGIADEGFMEFYDALYWICRYLAVEIARDGEGASKLLTVHVLGLSSVADARQVAKSIAGSSLVKTALFGEDANWGRILAAAGYAGVDLDPDRASITISSAAGSILVARGGQGLAFDEGLAKKILEEKEITYQVTFQEGDGSATAWTCDFSYDYVRINADYRS